MYIQYQEVLIKNKHVRTGVKQHSGDLPQRRVHASVDASKNVLRLLKEV